MEQIKVAIKGAFLETITVGNIDNDLKAFQSIVGGYIEVVTLDNGVLCICNDEGAINGMPHNFDYKWHSIHGTVFFVSQDGEDFGSLSDDQIQYVESLFEFVF